MPIWVRIHAVRPGFVVVRLMYHPSVTSSSVNVILTFGVFQLDQCHSAEDLGSEAILAFPCAATRVTRSRRSMQQLLCELEYRLGPQAPSPVIRPNPMIARARRSALITSLGATCGGDGAEVTKASRARKNGVSSLFLILLTQFLKAHPFFCGID